MFSHTIQFMLKLDDTLVIEESKITVIHLSDMNPFTVLENRFNTTDFAKNVCLPSALIGMIVS